MEFYVLWLRKYLFTICLMFREKNYSIDPTSRVLILLPALVRLQPTAPRTIKGLLSMPNWRIRHGRPGFILGIGGRRGLKIKDKKKKRCLLGKIYQKKPGAVGPGTFPIFSWVS